ncbi:MAG: ABC transporter ATP-binding protein [Ruminococcaceae bacterium]|nr:ABC transporter ATP-binding protein [Oscillospiraceae bacterium]
MAIVEIRDLHYGYGAGEHRNEVLRGLEATFEAGQAYAVTGKSGAGKSTLLSLLSALTLPQQGEILFEGKATASLDPLEYRRRCVAVIYQDFALFPLLNVTENIMYPMELCGVPREQALADARHLAEQVGLPEELLQRYPSAISGGEQQRVAIARGMAMDRRLILADEPTGNLDSENSDQIVRLLLEAAHRDGRCVIVVTHDMDVARQVDHVLQMRDGVLIPVS